VPETTHYDEEVCEEVSRLGFQVSPREVRTLREYGVIEVIGDHRGGRGKAKKYAPGTAHVVAAVQAAKTDPGYRRKLCRAVLIAWVRGAPVGTAGLRWALREYLLDEERTNSNLLNGKRVSDPDRPEALTPSIDRALAAARRGRQPKGDDLAELERLGEMVHEAARQAGHGDLLPAHLDDGDSLGLVERRTDGTARVTDIGRQVWGAQALAPFRKIAREAARNELDAARDRVRPMMRSAGFEVSDLVVAECTPGTVMHLRRVAGPAWWTPSPRSDRRRR
jgi:hypothetical protein